MQTETLKFTDRAAWIEARRQYGIGSSDAPAILGLSRYQTPFGLYTEKLGLLSNDRERTEQIEWGNILEEPIAQRYALETNRTVRNPRPPGGWLLERSRLNEFMVASVDRYTTGDLTFPDREGVLEIKNAHLFMADDWLELQEPPAEFQVQLQHQLAVTGAPWGSIACLIGGCKFVWKDIARDDEFIELLIAKEREFWNRLINRTPPPIDGSDMTRAVIGRLHPKDSGNVIELPPDVADLLAERDALKVQDKKSTVRLNEIEGQIKLILGDNTAGTLRDGTVVTWKWQRRAAHQVKESEFRQLRVALPKAPAVVQ